MRECGANPDTLKDGVAYLDSQHLLAYLEVHIEQGPVLDTQAIPVGIVTGIRGNYRFPAARCIGEYSHCGGVPRSHRRDAVIAVARLISKLDEHWDDCDAAEQDFAFTVGKCATDADWHAMTKISGDVNFTVDMRSLDSNVLDATEAQLQDWVSSFNTRFGVEFKLGTATRAAPGALDESIRAQLGAVASSLQVPTLELASGASHDAAAFAAAGVPTAMLFIRNANGSHNPHEAMALTDFTAATRILTTWLAQSLNAS
jgi:N-carbamoyl-L-amino-acid hydrolase